MRRGVGGTAGLLLGSAAVANAAKTPATPAKVSAKPKAPAKAKSVIQIFLWGGMSHSDTWDPKPKAGYDWTGEFDKVIPTNGVTAP